MALDPAALESIRNPTGGKLTQIGQMFAQASQRKKANELAERKMKMTEQLNKAQLDNEQMEAANLQSMAIGAFSQSVLEAMKEVPADQAKDPNVIAQIQAKVYQSMPEGVRKVIPDKPQSLEKIELGLENATIYQNWLNTKKQATGTSEFERLRNELVADEIITDKQADALTKKRVDVVAGLDVKKGKQMTENRLERKTITEQTSDLKKQYSKGSEHLRKMSNNVDAALAAMKTGDTELSDKLLAQVMSQVQDTDVRAFQMYGEFNKPFGNLMERITGQVSRFFEGSRSKKERDTIAQTLTHFKENYSEKSLAEMRNMYRNQAKNLELDPFLVVPPDSPEDIRDYPNIGKEEKMRLLKLFYPEMFTK